MASDFLVDITGIIFGIPRGYKLDALINISLIWLPFFFFSVGLVFFIAFVVAPKEKRDRLAGITLLIILVPTFWDLPMTLIGWSYYCKKESGFWQYKTPEQWLLENPQPEGGYSKPELRKRFSVASIENENEPKLMHYLVNIAPKEKVLRDVVNGEVLARARSFKQKYWPILIYLPWKKWYEGGYVCGNMRQINVFKSEFEMLAAK